MGGIRRLGAGTAIGAMATGLVGGAPDPGVAAAAQEMRLTTSIALVGQSSVDDVGFATYAVTVRSDGGTARDTQVAVTALRPARWSSFPTSCHASQSPVARLVCALGDVTGSASVMMILQVPAEARISGRSGIVAVAGAANATRQSAAGAAVPLSPWATVSAAPARATPSASAASPATAATPSVTAAVASGKRQTAQAAAGRKRTQAPRRPVPPLAQRPMAPLVRPMTPPRLSLPSTPRGPWLPTLDPEAPFVAPPTPDLSTVPSEPQVPDDTSQMSLTTMPQTPGGRESWAKALAVVVIAEAAVLWLAASLGLWRRRLLLGQAVGNGARNVLLLRPAVELLRRVPRRRMRLASRRAASRRWSPFRR
jgi:hypothetical protein